MASDRLPELLEIEYSFNLGGHNSLKLVDGRFFFFSEADSNLSEKNEYLTLVSIPENSALKCFWEDLDHLGIWEWEENYPDIDDTLEGDIPQKIPSKGDVWQVKIIHGSMRISCKSWSSEPKSKDNFFEAVKKMVAIDIRLPFTILKERLSKD